MHKLLLILILHRSKPKPDHGFSLFEVIIALLVSSAFIMGTLQAMTINAVLQIKSERQAQATFLIQQDVERLQAVASAMDLQYIEDSDVLNPNNLSGSQLCDPVTRLNGATITDPSRLADVRFGADLVKELDQLLQNDKKFDGVTDDSSTETVSTIDYSSDPHQVFSSAGPFKQFKTDENGNVLFTNRQPVIKPGPEKDSVQTSDSKKMVVQVALNGSDDVSDLNFNNNILNKNYRLVRLMTVDSSSRYDLLQVYYRVGEPYDPSQPQETRGTDKDGDTLRDDEPGHKSIIAENYTEITPAALAECGF